MVNPLPGKTILFLAANPKGTVRLRLDQELREIEEGLRRSTQRDQFVLHSRWAVRSQDMRRAMLDLNPQIVHFSGHGQGQEFEGDQLLSSAETVSETQRKFVLDGPASVEEGLMVEDEQGQPELVSGEALADLFALFPDVECVVLNGCYSANQAQEIAQHVPYVVGMRKAIGDTAAIEFAVGFYDGLGAGRSIQDAYKLGRVAIRMANIAEHLTPVLIPGAKRENPIAPASPAAPSAPPPFIPSIYDETTWVERQGLTESLIQILQGQCRILALNGMTGIGKTALAERLVAALADGKQFCRLNLEDGGVTPEFGSSGAALLRSLGQEPTLEDQKDPKTLLAHLLQVLRSHPYRVQLDSMERLLEGNDREGWSQFCDPLWLELFRQLLAGSDCQSQLLLTTQDVPGRLEEIGSRYERFWQCQELRGLAEAEQLQLIQKRGLSVAGAAGEYWQRIGKLYAGHPLVLRVIAEDVKTAGGNVERYWRQGGFEEMEANRPAKLTRRKLQLGVKQRVRDSIDRLPNEARQLLCRSAVYRLPVPEAFWLAMLPDREEPQAALDLLKSYTLAEEDWPPESWLGADGSIPLRQHNLVRAVAYELLQADPAAWELAERTAAEQWLTAYEPAPTAPPLEQVRGYLEAFHHACERQDWEAAKTVLLTHLNTPTKDEVYWQLGIWGFYREQIQLCQRIRGKLDTKSDGTWLSTLGSAYYSLGNYVQAIEFYQQNLSIAQEIGDRRGEGNALGNLGSAYSSLGNYAQAIEFHQQNLSIAQEIGDRQGEGNALGGLGSAYSSLGNYAQAIEFYQQNLSIAQEIGDRRGEGNALGNLGSAYSSLGNYAQAIEFHQQNLSIAQEIGDRQGEGNALGGLGLTYYSLGNYAQAIEFYQQYLSIAQEIGDRQGESAALGGLGFSYDSLSNYAQAIESHQQALSIAQEIGDRSGEGYALGNLGITFIKLERYAEALENLQFVLERFREIGHRAAEAEALKHLAELHQKLGQIDRAREYGQQGLAIAKELGIPLVQECEELLKQLKS